MRTRVKGTARAALITASLAAVGVGTFSPVGAYADTTSGDFSVLGGNQFNIPVSVPVNVCGNAAAVLGTADAGCEGGAKVKDGGYGGGKLTSGHHGVLAGNQAAVPVSLPINICGNAVGNATASCMGGAAVHSIGSISGDSTSGRHSVGGGNQVTAPIKAPVNVCGNAVAVLGDATAGCAGGSSIGGHPGHSGHNGHDCYGEHKGDGYRTYRAASQPTNSGLPVDPSTLPNIPGQLPTLPQLPVQVPQGLPQSPVQGPLPAGARTASASPLGDLPVAPPVSLPGGLSSAPKLGGTLPVAPPAGLPAAPKLPGALPVASDNVSAPLIGDVTDQVDAIKEGTTGLAPMAKSQLLTSGVNPGSAYVLVVGALLATAAAAMAFTRRIRFGHR